MTHTSDASYYPRSGLFRYKSRLLSTVRSDGPGWHFWHAFVHHPPGVRSIVCRTVGMDYILDMRLEGEASGVAIFLKRVWPMRPIQRLIRRFLARQRALAFMMAFHPRLGQDALVSRVTADVGRLICAE